MYRSWFVITPKILVLPNPPINLTAISKTPNSLLLYWEIPLGVQTFPKGLQHRILYTCDECGSWILATIIRNNKRQPRTMKYNLTGLPYAHYLYDIRVAMASNITTDERMWSNNASITPRTGSKSKSFFYYKWMIIMFNV